MELRSRTLYPKNSQISRQSRASDTFGKVQILTTFSRTRGHDNGAKLTTARMVMVAGTAPNSVVVIIAIIEIPFFELQFMSVTVTPVIVRIRLQ